MVVSQKLITRYGELKQTVPGCLLLMQVGAFMQVMDKDAQILSQLTGLKLQKCRLVKLSLTKETKPILNTTHRKIGASKMGNSVNKGILDSNPFNNLSMI